MSTNARYLSFALICKKHQYSRMVFQFEIHEKTGRLNQYGKVMQYIDGSTEPDPGFYVNFDGNENFFTPSGAYDAPTLRKVWKILTATGNFFPDSTNPQVQGA